MRQRESLHYARKEFFVHLSGMKLDLQIFQFTRANVARDRQLECTSHMKCFKALSPINLQIAK